jgi:hypothetical protein
MSSARRKSEAKGTPESSDNEPVDLKAGLLTSDESATKQIETKIDKEAAYKDLPNILILICLYFLQGLINV